MERILLMTSFKESLKDLVGFYPEVILGENTVSEYYLDFITPISELKLLDVCNLFNCFMICQVDSG